MKKIAIVATGIAALAISACAPRYYDRYDRYGYASQDTTLRSLEFVAAAQARRKAIAKQNDSGNEQTLRATLTGFGVDPQRQEVWLALGDQIILVDADGNRSNEVQYTIHCNGG